MNKNFLFFLIAFSNQTVLYKMGSRSEMVVDSPIEDEHESKSFSTFFGKFKSKIFDATIYQYPLEQIDTQINLPSFSPSPAFMKSFTYIKEVDPNSSGLHRQIKYELSFQINQETLNLNKLKSGQCSLAIIDYCDYGFYIEFEDLLQTPTFKFIENERMDIEKMDSETQQFPFYMELKLTPSDFELVSENNQNLWQFSFSKQLNFHLRYGEANRMGSTLFKLSQSFDFATNCFQENLAEKSRLDLMLIPRYKWALESLFENNPFSFFVLNRDRKVQNFVIPVGNTSYNFWIQLSTKALACYGVTVIMMALFFKPEKPKQKVINK